MKAAIRQRIADRLHAQEKQMTLGALNRSYRLVSESDVSDREQWLYRGNKPARIHPEVLAATADELIAAGWGWHERCLIPPDFQTKRPNKITARREKLGTVPSQGVGESADTRKKAEVA